MAIVALRVAPLAFAAALNATVPIAIGDQTFTVNQAGS